MQLLLILRPLVLLTVANGTPVIAKDILGYRFAIPIDGGARRLLRLQGNSKVSQEHVSR